MEPNRFLTVFTIGVYAFSLAVVILNVLVWEA
jgi:hypothetical protein